MRWLLPMPPRWIYLMMCWREATISPASLILTETVLEPLFQELILQGELLHQPLQLLFPVLESPFLGGLVIELTPALLFLPVIKHA